MKRWLIALVGTTIQLCLGTVYAWSYFQKLLASNYGWTQSQTMWTFSLAICFLGLAAAWGGSQLAKRGPRVLAFAGGICFGLGYLLAAAALHFKSLPLFYAGYGVVGGIGLGLAYVTPVAAVAKWFPDKKGLATGMVILGFGMGALLMSKVLAPFLMKVSGNNMVTVFSGLGLVFIVVVPLLALALKNPPALAASTAAGASAGEAHAGWFNGKFMMMWLAFFCNITAGIALISFQSPMLQDLLKQAKSTVLDLAAAGATLIAVSSLFNGIGRMFWGGISDKIGRAMTFRLLLGSQILVFIALTQVTSPVVFSVLVCYVLLCYGGGFGTMPSFVQDMFGSKNMAAAYGAILTAWSAAGIVGPQVVAVIKDRAPANASVVSFWVTTGFVLAGFVVTLFLKDKKPAV
jgi:OFA family oxalate/formate antiporter-like MFS transporter